MSEAFLMVGTVWLFHAMASGLPAIAALLAGRLDRWVYALLLVIVPFWALLPAQMLWPVGGMSSYLTRLIVLTVIVFVAELIEVLLRIRKTPEWIHLLLLVAAVLSVVPIQLVVPSLSD